MATVVTNGPAQVPGTHALRWPLVETTSCVPTAAPTHGRYRSGAGAPDRTTERSCASRCAVTRSPATASANAATTAHPALTATATTARR
ncbi:hypothetical protein GALL_438890 [mine drainage metagenome]|uniref:Uncharacterized protein n=1 Tax=mine drainage metagenome TaxID=410659 RepID=A0A1J5Q3I7_9ZZZZ